MSCELDQELLTGYIDGELSPAEQEAVQKHLPGCDTCRQELAEFRELVGSVKGLPVHPAPASIADGIRKGLDSGGGKVHSFSRKKWSWVEWGLSSAAVLFIAVNVGYVASLPMGKMETPQVPVEDMAHQNTREMASKSIPPKSEEYSELAFRRKREQQNLQTPGSSEFKGSDKLRGSDKHLQNFSSPETLGVTTMGRVPSVQPGFLTFKCSNVPVARVEVEKNLRAQNISFVRGAGNLDQGVYAKENCLLVELTEEQLEDLRRKLGGGDDILVMAGGLDRFRRNMSPKPVEKLGGKKAPPPNRSGKKNEKEGGVDVDVLVLQGENRSGERKSKGEPESESKSGQGADIPDVENDAEKLAELSPEKVEEKPGKGGKEPAPEEQAEGIGKKDLRKEKNDSEPKKADDPKSKSRKIRVVIYFVEKE